MFDMRHVINLHDKSKGEYSYHLIDRLENEDL